MGNSRKGKFDAKHIEAVTATIATQTITTADIETATIDDLTLSSTYYRRMYIPVQDMHSTGGATYSIETASTAQATVVEEFLAFDEATSELASFSFMMPADWKVGTAITPYVSFMSTSNTSSTQFVGWGLGYVLRDSLASTVAVNLVTSLIFTSAPSTVALEIKTTNFTAITMTSYDIDTIFSGNIFRNATASTDNWGKDAQLLGVTIGYEVDTLGTTSAALSSKS